MSNVSLKKPVFGDNCYLIVPNIQNQDLIARRIKGGSAIVTAGLCGDKYLAYYEGNLYGASHLNCFHERALVAYGRLVSGHPTGARMFVIADSFEVIGKITNNTFEIVHNQILRNWIDRDPTLNALSSA